MMTTTTLRIRSRQELVLELVLQGRKPAPAQNRAVLLAQVEQEELPVVRSWR
jgi:hypothetical protein